MDSTSNANGSRSTPNTSQQASEAHMKEHAEKQKKISSKYRHVAAVHAEARTSCLSHDSEHSPSFLGFRNLMVIVLGNSSSDTVLDLWSQTEMGN